MIGLDKLIVAGLIGWLAWLLWTERRKRDEDAAAWRAKSDMFRRRG